MNKPFNPKQDIKMDIKQASKLYQRMESDCAKLIKASLQDDASKQTGIAPEKLSEFTLRLASIRRDMLALHSDIGGAAPQMRGPGDKDEG